MSNLKISSAEHVDNHRRLLFITMFLLSLIFAIKAALYVVEGQLESYLEFAGKGIFGLFLLVLVITVYWKVRFIPGKERYLLNSSDSYVNQMMNQASKISWILTVVLLCILSFMINKDNWVLPGQFYVDLTLFFMLAIFSISFFILFRIWDKGEHQNASL